MEKTVEMGAMSRGKMVKYCEYDAYNSDDSSDYAENNYESNLFQRYGLESRSVLWDNRQLPKAYTTTNNAKTTAAATAATTSTSKLNTKLLKKKKSNQEESNW